MLGVSIFCIQKIFSTINDLLLLERYGRKYDFEYVTNSVTRSRIRSSQGPETPAEITEELVSELRFVPNAMGPKGPNIDLIDTIRNEGISEFRQKIESISRENPPEKVVQEVIEEYEEAINEGYLKGTENTFWLGTLSIMKDVASFIFPFLNLVSVASTVKNVIIEEGKVSRKYEWPRPMVKAKEKRSKLKETDQVVLY